MIMINRRSFLSQMLKLGCGAALLPAAVTYARQWKPVRVGVPIVFNSAIAATTRRLFDEQASFHIYQLSAYYEKEVGLWLLKGETSHGLHVQVLHGSCASVSPQLIL